MSSVASDAFQSRAMSGPSLMGNLWFVPSSGLITTDTYDDFIFTACMRSSMLPALLLMHLASLYAHASCAEACSAGDAAVSLPAMPAL